jgi:hypothetical protein
MELARLVVDQKRLLVVVLTLRLVTTTLMQCTMTVLVLRMTSVEFVAVMVSLTEHVIVTVTFLTH